ncbi:hypothetical protein V5O48_008300 [Marasmius crinis-equi]|uniref:Uncharacterized protein n=1 Tax=Marasmius crinis-equi TaxID=585013 RepID=A0ABR3FEL5_9AGAR
MHFANGFEWKRWPETLKDYFVVHRDPLYPKGRTFDDGSEFAGRFASCFLPSSTSPPTPNYMSSASFGKRKAEESELNEEKRRRLERDLSPAIFEADEAERITTALSDSEFELLNLLDLSNATSETEIKNHFETIASKLLSGSFHLVVRRKTETQVSEVHYELLEIEFYLWKSGCHEDPFTHGSEEQRISGRWYFHRAPKKSEDASRSLTSSGYRGGTRKGLDLTLGCAPPAAPSRSATIRSRFFGDTEITGSSDCPGSSKPTPVASGVDLRGGILLRSMRRLGVDEKVISGPSLLVDEILKQSDPRTDNPKALGIADVVDGLWKGDISAFSHRKKDSRLSSMFLKAVERPALAKSGIQNIPTIYKSPRIGLELSHPGTLPEASHPRVIYLNRRYRYFVNPRSLIANGRVQTFLGILDVVQSEDMTNTGRDKIHAASKERIAELTGLKAGSVANYLNSFLEGYEEGKLKAFVGPSGKGASSSPATYLRMMGTLAKILAGS